MVATVRTLGVVYTPPEVSSPMVRLVLDGLGPLGVRELRALRICDPAVGEGAFLLELVHALAARLIALWEAGDPSAPASRTTWHGEARRLVASCACGVDIDARAVATARAALPGADLHVADALALDWATAFPAVFARGGFDGVIGNPPYIRQERIAEHKRTLRDYAVYDGVADLYVYFVELAHRIARPGGRYCLIVPNKWMSAAYGRPLRTYLAAQHSVEGLADFARATQMFADADAFPCIVWGATAVERRTEPVGIAVGASGRPARGDRPIRAVRVLPGTSVDAALAAPGVPHDRDRWSAEPWHVDAREDRALIDRLESRWPALGTIVEGRPSRGVVTGCNRAFVIDADTRERLIDADPAAAVLIRPLVKGRDVRAFVPAPIERWILLIDRGTSLTALPASVVAHLEQFRSVLEPRPPEHRGPWPGRKPGSYAWHELQDPVGPLVRASTPRLLYQDIQTAPACCLDLHGTLVPDTTVWILPTTDPVVLAILNSSIYGWYARRRFPPALNGSVRPKLDYIRLLPIAQPSPASRARIATLVERRLVATATAGAELGLMLDRAILDAYDLTTSECALIAANTRALPTASA